MSKEISAAQGCGTSFSGLLTILFIGLKLTGYINWSWWWVLAPLWISFILTVIILIMLLFIVLLTED